LAHFSVLPDRSTERLACLESPEGRQHSTSICLKTTFSGSTSYERALQAHARYRPVDEAVPAPQQTASVDSIRDREVNLEEIALRQNAALSNDLPANNPDASPYRAPSSSRERNLKCASITIRLSQLECTQLRTRAAEAGLSVSAYLRSCTFEAEALRAEVKETLAQLRTGESSEKPHPPAPDRRSWFHWRTRHSADKS
jgi:predicted DNA binding CopG/RHH family protein